MSGRNGAAARLGMARTTLIFRMRRLGIEPAMRGVPSAHDSPSSPLGFAFGNLRFVRGILEEAKVEDSTPDWVCGNVVSLGLETGTRFQAKAASSLIALLHTWFL